MPVPSILGNTFPTSSFKRYTDVFVYAILPVVLRVSTKARTPIKHAYTLTQQPAFHIVAERLLVISTHVLDIFVP